MKQLDQVSEFMQVSNQPILDTPQIPNSNRIKLRCDLIAEELIELKSACNDQNIIEVADALGDLLYVVLGAVNEFGLNKIFEEIFDEIHRSNMSKFCDNEDESIKTSEKYMSNDIAIKRTFIGNKWIISNFETGKVLKSINYSKPNLKEIIDNVI